MRDRPTAVGTAVAAWSALSLDAKVVGALALGNWLLLFANHTVVQVSRDAPLWQLFPGLWGVASGALSPAGIAAAVEDERELAPAGAD